MRSKKASHKMDYLPERSTKICLICIIFVPFRSATLSTFLFYLNERVGKSTMPSRSRLCVDELGCLIRGSVDKKTNKKGRFCLRKDAVPENHKDNTSAESVANG